MTLTIAARWQVTLGVQSLARVALPPRTVARKPARDLATERRVRKELASDRERWESEMFLSTMRRMY